MLNLGNGLGWFWFEEFKLGFEMKWCFCERVNTGNGLGLCCFEGLKLGMEMDIVFEELKLRMEI